jgi:hypothetical protein
MKYEYEIARRHSADHYHDVVKLADGRLAIHLFYNNKYDNYALNVAQLKAAIQHNGYILFKRSEDEHILVSADKFKNHKPFSRETFIRIPATEVDQLDWNVPPAEPFDWPVEARPPPTSANIDPNADIVEIVKEKVMLGSGEVTRWGIHGLTKIKGADIYGSNPSIAMLGSRLHDKLQYSRIVIDFKAGLIALEK